MTKTILIVTIIAGLTGVSFLNGWQVEETSTYSKKEVINDITFLFRQEVANGKQTSAWTIDGRTVDQEEFTEAALDAEKEVRRAERIAQQEQLEREAQAKLQVRVAGQKKLLQFTVTSVEEQLHKLRDYRLEPYLTFNEQISREFFDQLSKTLVPEAKRVLQSSDVACADVERLLDQLDPLPAELAQIFYVSAHQAIKECPDTKLLKDLLAIVS